jgi:hypothetical protein
MIIGKIAVQFDPSAGVIHINRIAEPGGLLKDIDTACNLNLITSDGVCRSLKAKAEGAAEALKKGHKKAAREKLEAFLKELKAQAGKHAQESAATILKEEAQALLMSLGDEDKGDRDKDKKENRKD